MRLHHALITPLLIAALSFNSAAQEKHPDSPTKAVEQAAQISEYVREVFEDRDGSLWFGTNSDGVCRYDGKSLTYLSVEQGLSGTAIRGILQDTSGVMWFATDGGVSRYDKGTFTNYTAANGLSDNEVWSLMRDKAGTIWAGTQGGVCRLEGQSFVSFQIPRVQVENPMSRFTPKVVFGMFQDQAGNMWFGTDGEGVHRYDGKSFTSYTTKEGLAGNQVRCVYGDRLGRIWIGTDGGGVSCFDGARLRTFTSKDGLNNDRVFEVLEDKAGNMWFSTLGAGACRYDGKRFTPLLEDRGLTRSHVQSMFEDRRGILWFGCSGGLFRLDGESFVNVTRNGPWPEPVQSSKLAKGADGSTIVPPLDPVSLEGWQAETFALPPGFAPELPKGTESLRFAPGWRDPSAESFWSYAFVMWINEPAPSAARIDELLEKYYAGLMSSFALAESKDISATPTRVELVRVAPNHFEAEMHLIDAFATFKPIELRVAIETVAEADRRTSLRIRVSPRSKEHAIWRSLEAAIASILSREGALEQKKEDDAVNPLAPFARMVGGEWRRPALTQFDTFKTWLFGPGEHSIVADTAGTGIDGEPVRGLEIYYWHPGQKQICLLGLSSYYRGVSEGTFRFEGETAEAVYDLYQFGLDPRPNGGHRKMGSRWSFSGPDNYHSLLLETTGSAGMEPIADWDYVRFKTLSAKTANKTASVPSDYLKAFAPLLVKPWESKGPALGKWEWGAGDLFQVRTSFEYVPFAEVVHARVMTQANDDKPTHMMDMYVYHHTKTKALRCLALSHRGGVYEGDVTVLEGGAIQLDLKGYEGERVVAHVARLDFEKDGTLRNRVWSREGNDLELMLDLHLKR